MKKTFTLILIAFISTQSFSQSAYKFDIEPVIGEDYVRHAIDNADTLNPGPAGIGQTWDFSNATFSLQNDFYLFVRDPASTPHNVPGSSFAIQNYASWDTAYVGYEYFKDTADGFYALHEYGAILEVNYPSHEFIWKFPLIYGDSTTSSFSFSTTGFSITYNYTATSKLKLDGIGTLMMGSTPIPNVLRFKYEQMSIRQSPNDTSYSTTYFWYLAGIHHPLFEYTAFLDPSGVTFYSARSYSNSNTTGIASRNSDNEIQFFVDPANDRVHVKSTSNIEKIVLNDVTGKQILMEDFLSQQNYSLNIENLLPGIYFLSINAGNRFLVREFVKQ